MECACVGPHMAMLTPVEHDVNPCGACPITDSEYFELCCVQIFDEFVPCLKDVNGKVTLTALGVLCDILPCVGPHMANVVRQTVSTVAANLASSSQEIHDAASQAVNQLIQLVGAFS